MRQEIALSSLELRLRAVALGARLFDLGTLRQSRCQGILEHRVSELLFGSVDRQKFGRPVGVAGISQDEKFERVLRLLDEAPGDREIALAPFELSGRLGHVGLGEYARFDARL